ncbi:hypothetical protein KY290_000821 [Solanum tuberosum]|uniref:Uncharacterized protein n=1 Tax=Solanum tuberosum TaxID=4113 RepID=A0ABQ7WKG0_SOLTU|nr:hypothetical protein KY289_000964 [Solanum tuberosum]KAH0781223.1 hypothetical protein KY290_000821 [Solanum tuberosum]
MGVTGGVKRRCEWRLGRWGAGYGVGRKENSEVKRAWARVVLGLVNPWEVLVNNFVRTGDGGVGKMGVTGGVMRRCAWRLGRWGAG